MRTAVVSTTIRLFERHTETSRRLRCPYLDAAYVAQLSASARAEPRPRASYMFAEERTPAMLTESIPRFGRVETAGGSRVGVIQL